MRTLVLIGIVILLMSATVSAELLIVVNGSNPESSISREDAKDIFLGKKKRWDNGNKIEAVTLESGRVHEMFLEKVVDKSLSQFDTYWKRIAFTGKGRALKSFDTEKKVVEYVADTPDAIGYIDSGIQHDGVKAIPMK